MNVNEVQEMSLGALDLLFELVHDLVFDAQHVLAQVNHLLCALGRPMESIIKIGHHNFCFKDQIF